MPWDFEPKKDVLGCDKPRQAVKKRYSRGFPNGETLHGKTMGSFDLSKEGKLEN